MEGVAFVDQRSSPVRMAPPSPELRFLLHLEAEAAGGAQRADLAAAPLGQVGLAGVLHHRQLVLSGDGQDRVHVGDRSAEMHRQDQGGSIGDGRFDLAGVDLERLQVGIDEDRQGVVSRTTLTVAMNV